MKRKIFFLNVLFFVFLLSSFTPIMAQSEREDGIIIPATEKKQFDKSFDVFKRDVFMYSLLNKMETLSHYAILPNSDFDFSKPVVNFFDYRINGEYRITNKLHLMPYSQTGASLGVGEYNTIGTYLKWSPFRNFALEGGGFFSVLYGYHSGSKEIIYGYNWAAHYDITNNLQLSLWGQYLIHQGNDPFLNYYNLTPKSSVGGSLDFKPKESTKVGIGTEYQYDQQNKKWKPETKAKVSIGF